MSSTLKPLTLLKTLVAIAKLVRNPSDLPQVFVITNGLRETERMQQMIARLAADPGCAALIRERYQGPLPELDALSRLPVGSLGYEFAHHMRAQKLDVVFYPRVEVKDDLSFIELRLRSTHDIWHVITGLGVDVAGEIALQSFMMAQGVSVLGSVLLAIAFLRFAISGPGEETATATATATAKDLPLSRIMDSLAQGWQLGKAARPLFAQRWEAGWARPLADWRRELGIVAPSQRLAA